jgi:hypothetical protein
MFADVNGTTANGLKLDDDDDDDVFFLSSGILKFKLLHLYAAFK